ncbi:MAG: hypothetical protein M1826_003829 [Phylliscum demangeonii]|nr:MAG: hypothetical protein M1826_003829 [Phylliscum demangeonii]
MVDKPAPSVIRVRRGLHYVLAGLEWRHQELKPLKSSQRDLPRLDTTLDARTKAGKLTSATTRIRTQLQITWSHLAVAGGGSLQDTESECVGIHTPYL